MKVKIMLLLLMVFLFGNIIAQDTIMKVNGVKIVVKVTEVNTSSVKYTVGNNTMDHLYEINKNDIHMITYQNGVKEFFAPLEIVSPEIKKLPTSVKREDVVYGKNIIALNFFEMAFTNLSFSYERIFESGDFSIKIPLSFSLGGKPVTHDYGTGTETMDFLQNKIYGTGLEFNYYPFKQTRHTFYIGLSAAYGTFNYYVYNLNYQYYNSYGYNYVTNQQLFDKHIGIHYSGLIHVGGYLGMTDKILMGGKVGIGFKHEETIFIDYTRPRVQLDFNLAYRF